TDVDNAPSPLACHRAAADLTTKKRPLRICGHDFVPRRLRIRFERSILFGGAPWRIIEAGIVDEAMRWSPDGFESGQRRFERHAVGYVDREITHVRICREIF